MRRPMIPAPAPATLAVNTGSRSCTVSRLVIARADVQIDGDTYRASGMWRSAEERGALVFYPLTHDVEAHPGTPAARELGPTMTVAIHGLGFVREALHEALETAARDWSNDELLYLHFDGCAPLVVAAEYMEEDLSAGLRGDGAAVTAVNGAELPACPYSPESRAETARVLVEAGVPAEIDHEMLTTVWETAWHARVGRVGAGEVRFHV